LEMSKRKLFTVARKDFEIQTFRAGGKWVPAP
jgi:hypothetical protein